MREAVPGHVASKGCTEGYPDTGAWDVPDGLPRHGGPFLTIGGTFEPKRRRLRLNGAGRRTATASTGGGDDGLSSSPAGDAKTAGGPERRRRRRHWPCARLAQWRYGR